MDFQNINFSKKEFKPISRTYINQQISKVKINFNETNLDYGHFNPDSIDDIRSNSFLLKSVRHFQKDSWFNFNFRKNEDDPTIIYNINMESVIDNLDPLAYKGIRLNYLGNIYDKKSYLTPINSLPKIDYNKNKFTL